MKKFNGNIKKYYTRIQNDELYKNSVNIIGSSVINAGLGLIFWTLAARLYPPSDIGVTTSMMGVVGFILSLSLLGLTEALVRFLPSENDKRAAINTATYICILTGIIITLASIFILPQYQPHLSDLLNNTNGRIYYASYAVFLIISTIQDAIFVTTRRTGIILIKTLLNNLAKILIISFIPIKTTEGLFLAISAAQFLAMALGMIILHRVDMGFSIKIFHDIKSWFSFSFANYATGLVSNGVLMILPLMILSSLGPEMSAYYYVAYTISTGLRFIPQGISRSLFAEGSNNFHTLKEQVKKTVKFMAITMLPLCVILLISAEPILNIFGRQYAANGTQSLQILIIVSLLSSINYIGDVILNTTKRIKLFMITNLINALSTLVFVLPLLRFGLTGVSVGWLLSEILVVILYLYIFRHKLKHIFS